MPKIPSATNDVKNHYDSVKKEVKFIKIMEKIQKCEI